MPMVDTVEQEILKYKKLIDANPADLEARMMLGI